MTTKPRARFQLVPNEGHVNGVYGFWVELWERPFTGRMLAQTSPRPSKRAAMRAAMKWFRVKTVTP